MKKMIYGVGFNDADYVVRPSINGERAICHFYKTWSDMMKRCYSDKWRVDNQSYIGCSVSPEWHSFMAFKVWMETQDWQGNELDKDLLFTGNKTYSPDVCVFVSSITNSFTVDARAARGEWPIGVYFNINFKKFHARCCNPFTKRQEHLGVFECPNEAHLAWRKRKHEVALQLAELQTDERVANALRLRYL